MDAAIGAAGGIGMRHKARVVLPCVLALLLSVGWLTHRYSTPRVDDSSQQSGGATEIESELSGNLSRKQSIEQPLAGERESTSTPLPSRAVINIVVRCRNSRGDAISDVTVSFRLSLLEKRMGDVVKTRTTRADGSCDISCEKGSRVRVDVIDDHWFAAPVEAICTMDQSLELKVQRAATVKIRAVYDDGVPVTGLGEVCEAANAVMTRGKAAVSRNYSFALSFSLSTEGTAEIPKVPAEMALVFTLACKRSGYSKSIHRIDAAQIVSGQELVLVAFRSPEAGGLRVTFGETQVPGDCTLILEPAVGAASTFPLRETYTSSWDSGSLRSGQSYRVSVTGPLAGRSEWVTVPSGQTVEIVVALKPSGGAKLRILDPGGKPIANGCAVIGPRLVSYSQGKPRLGAGNVSDETGNVHLTGLPPGNIELSVEAWGFELSRVSVQIKSGEDTDLGDVVLHRAKGEITVILTGMSSGQRYRVGVGQRFSSYVVVPPPIVDGETYVLQGLPCRQYVVAVTLESGGMVVSREVELTDWSSAQTVYVDVSELKP